MIGGDHFQLWRKGKRWYWRLQGDGYPSGPIAQCRDEGYASKTNALSSMQSARRAVEGALDKNGNFRIDEIDPPRTSN